MKEQRAILYYIRDLLIRKTLYYSVLYFVFSLIIGISVILYNYFALPELTKIQAALKGIGTVWILISLLGPIRWFLLWLFTWLLPERWFYFLLKKYDEGRLRQGSVLSQSKDAVQYWASNKVFDQVRTDLVQTKNTWRKQFHPLIGSILLVVLVLLLIGLPSRIKSSSVDELIKGSYSKARPAIPTIPDSVRFNYGDVFHLESYENCTAFLNDKKSTGHIVEENFTIEWKTKGRLVKRQYIVVDSVPTLTSVVCEITPPGYMELQPYSGSDTLYIYPDSRLQFRLTGLLLNKIQGLVSRETIDLSKPFLWKPNTTIEFVDHQNKLLYEPVIIPLLDNPPVISVLQNSRDSIVLKLSDDFGLMSLRYSSKNSSIKGVEVVITIPWINETTISLSVSDIINQSASRTFTRPQENTQLLFERMNTGIANKLGVQEEVKELFQKSREVKQTDVEIDDLHKESKEIPHRTEKPDEAYEEWVSELEKLWKEELLINLLNEVDTLANSSLDSALQETVNELLSSEESAEKKDILEELKNIPNQGQEREDQAKEAAKKLSELLNENIATVQADNVERIKNLLKSSWLTSVLQEEIKRINLEVNKASVQKNLFTIESHLQDSLSYLLIHDQALAMALSEVSSSLGNSMRSLIKAFTDSKSTEVAVGYVIHDLNELSSILYDILESEKQALATANKNCKNGKPGKTGKPTSAGQGKPGPKGMPNEGKQPGGRKQGKNGQERKEGKDGEKGSSGKGTPKESDLLKKIEALSDKARREGNELQWLELERLKEELLFDSGAKNDRIQDIEEKLWMVENSVFSKEEQGSERSSNEGLLQQEKEVEYQIRPSSKSGTSDLPLPVLKKK